MLPAHLRRYVRAQRIFVGLAGLAFGVLVSVFANYVFERSVILLPWVATFTLVICAIGAILSWRQRPPGIEVLIQVPVAVATEREQETYARRAFIGFVPIYTPNRGSSAEKLSADEQAQCIAELDFERLQLEQSNLAPTIKAITNHASRLEHCWLLATSGKNAPGSRAYAGLLAEYLRYVKEVRCQFHYDRTPDQQTLTIPLDSDEMVLAKTYRLVRAVFDEASRLDIAPREIIADITTGFRSMTLGMLLACLDRERDVEFVGTHYNDRGQSDGSLLPIIFSFEPIVPAE